MTISKQYIAGLFDGEGCIGIYPNHKNYRIMVTLNNCDKRPLEEFTERYGGTVIPSGNGKNFTCYVVQLYSENAAAFLEDIVEHLFIKKGAAEVALEFHKIMKAVREGRCSNRIVQELYEEYYTLLVEAREKELVKIPSRDIGDNVLVKAVF